MNSSIAEAAKLDARQRVSIAILVSFGVAIALRTHPLWTLSLASYDTFAFVCLMLIWITIMSIPGGAIRSVARRQDLSATVIFAFVLIIASAAMIAVAFLLHTGRSDKGSYFAVHLLLAGVTVVLSWLMMHSVFALRYAHTFYGDSDDDRATHAGGLVFPGDDLPDYTDFAYFSFVIGMTCQVSDVQITSKDLRKLVLLHGILSFGFNTIILALGVNLIAALV